MKELSLSIPDLVDLFPISVEPVSDDFREFLSDDLFTLLFFLEKLVSVFTDVTSLEMTRVNSLDFFEIRLTKFGFY